MKKFWRWLLASVAVSVFVYLWIVLVSLGVYSIIGLFVRETLTPLFFGPGSGMWIVFNHHPLFAALFTLFFMILSSGMPYVGIKRGLIFGFFCWLAFFLPIFFGSIGIFALTSMTGLVYRILYSLGMYLGIGIIASVIIGGSASQIETKRKTNMVKWLIAGVVVGIVHFLFNTKILGYGVGFMTYAYCLPFFGSLIFGLLVVLFFMVFYDGLPGKGVLKGLFLGVAGWLVFVLPGLSILIINPPHLAPPPEPPGLFFKEIIIGLFLTTFLVHSVEGIIIAFVFGKSLEVKQADAGIGV